MAYGRNIFDEVAYQQSFDTPVLAGSHTFFMEEGAVFGSSRNLAVLMNAESSRTQLRLGFFLPSISAYSETLSPLCRLKRPILDLKSDL